MSQDGDDGERKYKIWRSGAADPHPDGSQGFGGFGKALYVNDDTYDGTFVQGRRHGKGSYFHAKNGDTYEGFWEENRKSNFGKMTYTEKSGKDDDEDGGGDDAPKKLRGGTYLGYFAEGKRGCKEAQSPNEADSAGTFTYPNNDVYVGQWRSGKKHGTGTYSYAGDGTQMIGDWESGKIVTGRWVFPNGTFYCGDFRYNKPTGRGVWVFKNGNQQTGTYIQNELKGDDDPEPDPDDPTPRPDPKVTCRFRPDKDTAVRGGDVFGPKCGGKALVKPDLDWPPPYRYHKE